MATSRQRPHGWATGCKCGCKPCGSSPKHHATAPSSSTSPTYTCTPTSNAHAIGSTLALKNAVGDRITTYCIFDNDYHSTTERTERYDQANNRSINLHIWERKEIENYLLDPNVIARFITQRIKKNTPPTPAM